MKPIFSFIQLGWSSADGLFMYVMALIIVAFAVWLFWTMLKAALLTMITTMAAFVLQDEILMLLEKDPPLLVLLLVLIVAFIVLIMEDGS